MKRALKWIGWIILAPPVLLIGQCMYFQVADRGGLISLCGKAKAGSVMPAFLESAAKNARFRARTGGEAGKSDVDWFDREYVLLGRRLKSEKKLTGDYSIVFAKPGIGYYACVVIHKDGVIQSAWFEDRGD